MMEATHLKRRIASNFSKSAKRYDQAARLQRLVGDKLFAYLPESAAPHHIIDLGAGTGFYSQRLSMQYPHASLIAVDLAAGMLRYAKQHLQQIAHYIQADADQLPLRNQCADWIFSNLMLQWCSDPLAALMHMRRCLRFGGQVFVTTLAQGSLHELASAWPLEQQAQHVNQYRTVNAWYKVFEAAGFRIKHSTCDTETLWYPRVEALLYELKALGANTVIGSPMQPLSRRRFLDICHAYEQFRLPLGLPASYQVVYACLE